jgi:hypothetical protein
LSRLIFQVQISFNEAFLHIVEQLADNLLSHMEHYIPVLLWVKYKCLEVWGDQKKYSFEHEVQKRESCTENLSYV